jgi:peptidoglycan/xylan/chitin deacetylase (PgdA/CDA1 family)
MSPARTRSEEADETARLALRFTNWKPHPGPVPILMYHLIQEAIPNAPYPELFVKPADFRDQVKWLDRQDYEAVTLDEVEDAWTRGKALPPKPVVLSFDDGYQSQAATAAPALDKLGWPGVLNLRGKGAELSDDKVKALIYDGWELASHTINHLDLTTLAGARLNSEVAGARQDLRRRFGVPVDNFCYPSGEYDQATIRAVKAAGHRGATTTDPGLASRDQPFALKRIRVSLSDGLPGLIKKLKSAERASRPQAAPR